MKRKSPFQKKKEINFKKKVVASVNRSSEQIEQVAEVNNNELSESSALFLEQLESPVLNLPLSSEQKGWQKYSFNFSNIDFLEIIDLVLKGESVFFTGVAGTGKSLVLLHIIRAFVKNIFPNTWYASLDYCQ